jgi:hypothetical protein
LIIVDECHRVSSRDKSNWRDIPEYLISMTLAAAVLSTYPAAAAEDESPESEENATLDDIQIYFEIHGKGNPLLLIMGLGVHILDWVFVLP